MEIPFGERTKGQAEKYSTRRFRGSLLCTTSTTAVNVGLRHQCELSTCNSCSAQVQRAHRVCHATVPNGQAAEQLNSPATIAAPAVEGSSRGYKKNKTAHTHTAANVDVRTLLLRFLIPLWETTGSQELHRGDRHRYSSVQCNTLNKVDVPTKINYSCGGRQRIKIRNFTFWGFSFGTGQSGAENTCLRLYGSENCCTHPIASSGRHRWLCGECMDP